MVTSGGTRADSTSRWFPRWITVLLALLLLTGLGSDLHGPDCACAGSPSEICHVCEFHPQESALVPAVLAMHSHFDGEVAYMPPRSERLVITYLEKDHLPPKQGCAI